MEPILRNGQNLGKNDQKMIKLAKKSKKQAKFLYSETVSQIFCQFYIRKHIFNIKKHLFSWRVLLITFSIFQDIYKKIVSVCFIEP